MKTVRDDGRDIEAGLEHDGHLVPGLIHLAAIDAFDREHVEDHLFQSIGISSAGMPSMAILRAVAHIGDHVVEGGGIARHFETDVEALLACRVALSIA